MGNFCILVSLTFNYGRFRSTPGRIYGVPTWRSFCQPEQRKDREVSVHTTHTSRSQSRNRRNLSHKEDTKALQLEIDHLKRKLRHEWRRRTPSNSDFSSNDKEDGSYRPRLRTPPSKSFSYDKDYHHEHRNRSSSSRGLGNDAMSRALNQISISPFTHRIERGAVHLAHVHHV